MPTVHNTALTDKIKMLINPLKLFSRGEKNASLTVHTGVIGRNPNTEIGTSPQENVLFSPDLRKH